MRSLKVNLADHCLCKAVSILALKKNKKRHKCGFGSPAVTVTLKIKHRVHGKINNELKYAKLSIFNFFS